MAGRRFITALRLSNGLRMLPLGFSIGSSPSAESLLAYPRISRTSQNLRTGKKEFFDAACILKASCLEWTLEEVPALVRHLLALESVYPLYLRQLSSFVQRKGLAGLEIEAFFLELMSQATAANNIDLLEMATSTVVKLLDRRSPVSSLPDTAVRGLPH